MNTRHIYWFAPYNLRCPSTKYRGKYPVEYFKNELNISCDFVYPEKSFKAFSKFAYMVLSILFFRKKHSLIVIQKICTNRIYAKSLKLLIKLSPKKSLYDIDDAEYIRHPKSTLEFFLKNCESISVGSTELYKYAKGFNKSVFIQTSPIIDHSIQKKKRNQFVNVGWVGDLGNGNKTSKEFSHKTSLFKLLFPELKKLNFPIKLSLIGVKNKKDIPEIKNYFKEYKNIEIDIPTDLDWEKDEWVYDLISKFDMGVSPMVNHLFNKSKSAFKAKQYLSCGVPTIACDVGDNKFFVKHNLNGFIITKTLTYAEAITKITTMTDEQYSQFSQNSIDSKNNYSMKNYCQNILNHFNS